ncbi:MAG: hypothetical protein JWR10_1319 [Rubritepida sp.]|nr:hypothetical protein [Rubritepida sp.]
MTRGPMPGQSQLTALTVAASLGQIDEVAFSLATIGPALGFSAL